jgi:hypothetical protein
MTAVGDLVVIQDKQKLRDSIHSFRGKWVTEMAMGTAMVTPATMGMATAMSTVTVTEMVTEKQTGKQIKLKYYGHTWKPFDRIIGIVTGITPEEHPDFDVIKIREQTGGVRYFRRFILENV